MADLVRFPLDFEDSSAYRSVDRLAAYTNKKFASIRFGGNSNQNVFSSFDRQARSFNRTLEFANDRMVAFAATTTIVYGLGRAFAALYQNAIKAEKALAEIQVNVKLTNREMSQLTSDLFKAANATGNSFYTAAEAAAEFGRQGLKAADIAKATHSALVLTQISGMDAADSVKSLTAAINTFGKAAGGYEGIVNKMAAADTSFAVSSKDLADAIGRVGSTAKDAGVGLNELLAMVTSLQQTTARGGAVIGNSLKTIFTRLQRDDVAASIENLGIKTKDAEGNFLTQIGVLRELAQTYDTLSDSQKSVISEKLGGVYQINIVKGIIQDLSKNASVFDQALNVVSRAQNEAFIKSEFLGRTAVNRINEATNSFVALGAAIGKIGVNSAVGNIAGFVKDALSEATDSLNKGVDTSSIIDKVFQSATKGLINAISGPGLAALAVGFSKLAFGVITRFSKDLGGTFSGRGAGVTRSEMEAGIESNRLRLIAIKNEQELNSIILRGNGVLQQRVAILSRINAGGFALPAVPFSAVKTVKPAKTAASGLVPAMHREASDIARGIGGAGRNAKPVSKKIKTNAGNSEKVVVNSHEVIVRNYLGSGADAVFNKAMIRQAGGLERVSQLGRIEKISGGTANFAGGYGPLGQSRNPVGKLLGSGIQGDFFELKNGIGVKHFRQSGVNFKTSSKDIANEYLFSKIINENKLVPGVTGPKVIGSIGRSIVDKRIGKEVISDSAHQRSQFSNLGTGIDSLLQTKGISIHDLHEGNIRLNNKAKAFFSRPKMAGLLNSNRKNRLYNENRDTITPLQRMFGRAEKYGAKINIIDAGMAKVAKGSKGSKLFQQYYDSHSSNPFKNAAKGFIPNLARGSGKTPMFHQRNTKELIQILQSSKSTSSQKNLAKSVLQKRGAFDNPSSLSYGLNIKHFSDKGIAKGAAQPGIQGAFFDKHAKSRGIYNNAKFVTSGIPIEKFSRSALREIAFNKSGSYRGDYVKKAQEHRKFLAAGIKTQRRNGLDKYDSVYSQGRSGLPALPKGTAPISREQKNLMSSSMFKEMVRDNPFATKKELKDYATLAGSRSGGSVSDKEFKSASRRARLNRWQQHSGKVAGASMAATFGGSIIGNLAGMPEAGNAISAIGVGASLGSAFGPVGAGLGVLAGTILALSSSMKSAKIPLAKLQENITTLSADTEKYQGAIQNYFSAKQDFDNIIKDPNASSFDIKSASRRQAIGLSEIPEEIRKQILNAPEKAFGDVQSKADIGNAFIQREQSRVNASLALDSIVSNADKANTGIGILVRQVQKDLGGKESVLRVDKEQLNKSISSFVNNYDFDKLDEISKGKGTKALDAGIAKNALSKGNFQEFLKFNGGLGIIPENILKDSLKIIKDISKADLYEATSSAVKSFNELSEAAKEKANQIARVKTSFEDFTNFERSFNKKNALSSIISSSNASLTSARFGIVADQSDTPDSIKQAISYGREISNLNQRESTVKNSASTDLMKIVSAVYGDTGRNSLNEAGGKDFMEKFLKGSLDANAIEANLEKVVKASETTVINGKSVEAFSGDQKEVLNTVSNDLKLQLTEIKIEKQIALEQLKALQEISKKQQFDKLISELRSRDPMATAIDNLNFGDIKKDFFSPDKKDARKIEKERAVAIRTKNSDVLTSQIQDRVDKTSKLLDLDDKKRERGEAGLSASERSRLLIDLTRAKTTEQVSLEADARKDEIRSRNLSTSSGAAKAVESARFQVVGGNGGGAGSFENLQKAVQILINKASEIPDPNNQDRQDLLALAASINETKTSQVGSSGVYENEKLSISTLLAGIQKEVENARNSAAKSGKFIDTSGAEKKANIYSEAKRALEEGGGADASKILSTFVSLGLKPSNQEEVNTVKDLISSTKNKSDRDKDKAFGSSILDKAKRDNGITDWSAAFTASATPIVASNTALNEALRNLGTDVRNLSGIMAKEAEIAGLSVNYSEAKNKEAELAAKVANLNGIIGSKSVLPEEWKRKDRLSKDPDTTSFMDLGNGPQNGSYASANPILVKEFEMAKAAASRLKKVNDAGTLTGRKGDRGDEYHLQAREEDLRVVKAYLEKQNDDHKLSMANTWEGGVLQPLKTNMVGKEAVSEDIIKLKETISELTKSILESNKAALELNKAKESKSTDAQSSNTDVTVNVSGLSDALGSLGPQIVALIESTTRNFLSMKEKAPKLFESMGSSNQAYA